MVPSRKASCLGIAAALSFDLQGNRWGIRRNQPEKAFIGFGNRIKFIRSRTGGEMVNVRAAFATVSSSYSLPMSRRYSLVTRLWNSASANVEDIVMATPL
jgi:hypothetical protein